MYSEIDLSPPGGTSVATTHNGVLIDQYHNMAFQFIVLSVGSTPTVTFQIQGSVDDPSISDANARWYNLGYITDSTDTIATTALTSTAVGGKVLFASNPIARQYRRFRLVTSALTNVTYYGQAFRIAS